MSEIPGIEYDINKRWEQGTPHHPKSEALFKRIEQIDFEFCDGYFDWQAGGDGDNGENLMYEMDIYFEEQDALRSDVALKERKSEDPQIWRMTPLEFRDWYRASEDNRIQTRSFFENEMGWEEGCEYCAIGQVESLFVEAHKRIVQWAVSHNKNVPADIRALYH
jgi:hypothetical protein